MLHDANRTPKRAAVTPTAAAVASAAIMTVSSSPRSPQRTTRTEGNVTTATELVAVDAELSRVVAHQQHSREYLPRLFRNDPLLLHLDLSGTDCCDVALVALADSIKTNVHLQSLRLDRNGITNEGTKLLGEAFLVNHSLEVVSITHNPDITDVGATYFINALQVNNHITSLDITVGNTRLSEAVATEIEILSNLNKKALSLKQAILAIKQNNASAFLNLSRAEISRNEFRDLNHKPREHLDDWCVSALSHYLAHDDRVTHLDLSFHHIGDQGAQHLGEMLRTNRTIDKINLQGNQITAVGARFIIDAIKLENITCRFVCLLKNLVNQEVIIQAESACVLNRQPLALKGILPLVESDSEIMTNVVLDVSACQRFYDDITARLITDAMMRNTHVQRLQLTNSRVTVVGSRFLADLISLNAHLRDVDFSANPIGSGSSELAKALTVNRSITSMKLSAIEMTDAAAVLFADMLRENRTLVVLDISNNPLITRAGHDLNSALGCNTTLLDLVVDGTGIPSNILDDLAERKRLNSEPPQVRDVLGQLYNPSRPCRSISLCGNNFPRKMADSSMRLLCEAVEANFTATQCDLSHNLLSYQGIFQLIIALFENKTTTLQLSIGYNPIHPRQLELAKQLAKLLQVHQTLQVLDLSGLGLKDDAVDCLAHVLDTIECYPIQKIVLDDNPEVTFLAKFNLDILVSFNHLQVRFKDVVYPIWKWWKRALDASIEENLGRRVVDPFPYKEAHLDLHCYSPAVDLSVPMEQERIDAAAEVFCKILRVIGGVTSVDYSENSLSDVGAAHFANFLKDKTSASRLTSLNLSKNNLTDRGVLALKEAAESAHELLALEIGGNEKVTCGASEAMTRAVLYNRQPVEVQTFLVSISNNTPGLTALDFSTKPDPQLNDDQVLLMSDALTRNDTVTSIDISHSHVTKKGLVCLLETLERRMTNSFVPLSKLVIRNLMMSDEDAVQVVQLLHRIVVKNAEISLDTEALAEFPPSPSLSPLTSLPLSGSPLTGKSHLFPSLEGCEPCKKKLLPFPLTHIDISCNAMVSEAVPIILDLLQKHPGVKTFNVSNCGFSDVEIFRITSAVSKNNPQCVLVARDLVAIVKACEPDTTELVAVEGELSDQLTPDLFAALAENPYITYLDISDNSLTDATVAASIPLLANSNSRITEMNVSNNLVGDQTVTALLALASSNNTLKSIDLRYNPNITLQALERLKDNLLAVNDSIVLIRFSTPEEIELWRHQAEAVAASGGGSRRGSAARRPSSASQVPPAGAHSTKFVSRVTAEDSLRASALVQFFTRDLNINKQLHVKRAIPLLYSNDPSLVSLSLRPTRPSLPPSTAASPEGNHLQLMAAVVGVQPPGTTSASPPPLPFGSHDDVGMELLGSALHHNTNLTSLNVSRGRVSDAGATSLAKALFVNRSVTSIDLSENEIGDAGITALTEALQVNAKVTTLTVADSRRPITEASLEKLKDALIANDSVRSVTVSQFEKSSKSGGGARKSSLNSSITSSRQITTMLSHRSSNSGTSTVGARPSKLPPQSDEAQACTRKVNYITMLNNRHLGVKNFVRSESELMVSYVDCSNTEDTAGLSGRSFDDFACQVLCNALTDNMFVTSLNLSGNRLGSDAAEMIAALLTTNQTLQSIDLSNNRIGDGCIALHDALVANHVVVSLQLQNNNCPSTVLDKIDLLLLLNKETMAFKEEILKILKKDDKHTTCAIRSPETREELRMLPCFANRKMQVDDESLEVLSSVLRADLIIQSLDLSWNAITDNGLHTILLLLKRNKGISSVKLSHNLLGDESVRKVYEMVAQLPSLRELDLSFNIITRESATVIVEMMTQFPTLQVCNVTGNRIPPRDLDSIEFLSRLNRNCSADLRSLLIECFENRPQRTVVTMDSFFSYGNWARDGSTMQLLCYALMNNTHVTAVSFEFNDIDNRQFAMLCNLLRSNRTIVEVNVSNNQIDTIDSFLEGDGFGTTKLLIRKNRLSMKAAVGLAAFLRKNTSLVELDVSFQDWGRGGASILRAALPFNVTLKELGVEGAGIPLELVDDLKYALTLDYRAA